MVPRVYCDDWNRRWSLRGTDIERVGSDWCSIGAIVSSETRYSLSGGFIANDVVGLGHDRFFSKFSRFGIKVVKLVPLDQVAHSSSLTCLFGFSSIFKSVPLTFLTTHSDTFLHAQAFAFRIAGLSRFAKLLFLYKLTDFLLLAMNFLYRAMSFVIKSVDIFLSFLYLINCTVVLVFKKSELFSNLANLDLETFAFSIRFFFLRSEPLQFRVGLFIPLSLKGEIGMHLR
jgi:hypothetical protein